MEYIHFNVGALKEIYSKIAVEIDGNAKPEDIAESIKKAILEKLTADTSCFPKVRRLFTKR